MYRNLPGNIKLFTSWYLVTRSFVKMVEYAYSMGAVSTKLELLKDDVIPANTTLEAQWYDNSIYRVVSGPTCLRVVSIMKSAVDLSSAYDPAPAFTIVLRISGTISSSLNLTGFDFKTSTAIKYTPEVILLPTLNYMNLPSSEGEGYIKSLTLFLLTNVVHNALFLVNLYMKNELAEHETYKMTHDNQICENPWYGVVGHTDTAPETCQ